VELATGERVRVQFDDHVQRLIDRGYIVVVEEYDAPNLRLNRRKPDGAAGADSGEPDTVRVAAEGADEGGAVDAAGEETA